MRRKNQLYEVEIKSQALIREGQRSLVTYFTGGNHKTIVSNVRKLYPQYTDPVDVPVVNIRKTSMEEYNARAITGEVTQKGYIMEAKGDINESLGN